VSSIDANASWPDDIFAALLQADVSVVAHVPDAGHSTLIERCDAHPDIHVVTLTTEQDGVGILSGAWAGGRKGALLIQSSGVGNCVNALALPAVCRIPLLAIVSMRGEWGEFIPWQIPMGQATPPVLEAMGVHTFRVDDQEDVGPTVNAAADFVFNSREQGAVLLSQRLIGAKQFTEG
jgi:sulfopyruvate decarboxylase alpha subunit